MGDIALRGNKLTRGPHGFGPKPYLNKPGQAQGTHGGKAKGGRIGLRHGKGPHGFGPKPYLHKPGVGPHGQPGGRKGKAIGGILKAGKQIVKKIISKIKKKPETTWKELDIPGYPPIHKGKGTGQHFRTGSK